MRFVKDSFVPSHFPRVANRSFTCANSPGWSRLKCRVNTCQRGRSAIPRYRCLYVLLLARVFRRFTLRMCVHETVHCAKTPREMWNKILKKSLQATINRSNTFIKIETLYLENY